MNERTTIYRESFHLKLVLKIRLFHLKVAKKQLWPALPTLGAHGLASKFISATLEALGPHLGHPSIFFLTIGVHGPCLERMDHA
jgi:hypothetical protein